MNLLILQSAGKHKTNAKFRECLSLQRSFARVAPATEVTVCGPGFKTFGKREALYKRADVILVAENYSKAPWIDLSSAKKAYRIFWTIDSHIAMARHITFAASQRIALVLQATRKLCANFERQGRKVIWWPNAYDSELVSPRGNPKRWGMGFCGSILNRVGWLAELSKKVGLHKDIFVLGEEMVRTICSYHVHWNKSYRGDINYRCFETLGCGTALLTNRVDGLSQLLLDGSEVITYTSLNDCIEKAKWLLSHPESRNTMAAAGYKRVRQDHTYDVRVRQLMEILREVV
jgi:hypothetical protein